MPRHPPDDHRNHTVDQTLSQRVRRVKPSPTLAVTAKAAELKALGKDVLSLGAGEPDFDTPTHIKDAAHKAINDGLTKYTPVGGTPALKKAICQKFERDNGLKFTADQILVSSGGKQSFFNLCQALLNAGDEVVIPAPYWVSYPDMVLLADGEPKIVAAGADQRFKITPDQLDEAMNEHTRLVVLNSPSNPSGMAYSRAELEALGEVLRKYPRAIIATDDMYELILWTREPFCNIVMACPDLAERTIVLNGASKAYSMTGWRIGYAGGPDWLIKAMTKIQSQSTSNPNSIAQAATVAALTGDQLCVKEMTRAFKARHDSLVEGLNNIPGIQALPGDGTFYTFPDVTGLMEIAGAETDVDLAASLLEKAGVALVPGSAFGTPGHVRISFASSDKVLRECVERLRSVAG